MEKSCKRKIVKDFLFKDFGIENDFMPLRVFIWIFWIFFGTKCLEFGFKAITFSKIRVAPKKYFVKFLKAMKNWVFSYD